MYTDQLLLPSLDQLRAALPELRLFDAHTHLGCKDPDGSCVTPEELLAALDVAQARAVTFPLMEPGGYRQANRDVTTAAEASDGRLVPFCRVDPHHGPLAELERSLGHGARGVKLHPRAERFDLRHPGVERVLAAAAERRLPVIVHAGLGIPSLGEDALRLAGRYPSAPLVLAHLGVTELAWIWRRLDDHPSLFFDTAWWNVTDHLALFARVPPGRILFGSDTPYGTPASAAIVAVRCALQAGLSPAQAGSVVGGQLLRLVAGEQPLDLGPPPPTPEPRSPLIERVLALLIAALSRMLEGRPADSLLELARLDCHIDDDLPEAPVLARVGELLDGQTDYAQRSDRDGHRYGGFHLVLVASAVAASPDVRPLPSGDAARDSSMGQASGDVRPGL
jgi:uncharacterized protein